MKVKTNSNANAGKMQWWKIGACVLGALMIVGAVTYVLMSRASAANTGTAANAAPATSTVAAATPQSDGVGELNWVSKMIADNKANDFVFVLLPGKQDATAQADAAVSSALGKMKQAGVAAGAMTLGANDSELSATMERLGIQKLPVVLLFAATGQVAIVKTDINETKLLQTYLTLVKTCAPGSGSGCCPK